MKTPWAVKSYLFSHEQKINFQYKLYVFLKIFFSFSTEILLQVPLHDVFVSHQQMLFIQNMSIYFIWSQLMTSIS